MLLSLGIEANKATFEHLRRELQGLNATVFDSLGESERAIVERFLRNLLESTHEALLRLRADRVVASADEAAN